MTKFLNGFRDLRLAKEWGIVNPSLVYYVDTGYICFWYTDKSTLKTYKDAELIC